MAIDTEKIRLNRGWLEKRAEAESQYASIAAGGLAADLGMIGTARTQSPRALSLFIELARRKRGLSLEALAAEAGLELVELVAIESWHRVPSKQAVARLARVLSVASEKLVQLAGLAQREDPELLRAEALFSARLEPTTALEDFEEEAYAEFSEALGAGSQE